MKITVPMVAEAARKKELTADEIQAVVTGAGFTISSRRKAKSEWRSYDYVIDATAPAFSRIYVADSHGRGKLVVVGEGGDHLPSGYSTIAVTTPASLKSAIKKFNSYPDKATSKAAVEEAKAAWKTELAAFSLKLKIVPERGVNLFQIPDLITKKEFLLSIDYEGVTRIVDRQQKAMTAAFPVKSPITLARIKAAVKTLAGIDSKVRAADDKRVASAPTNGPELTARKKELLAELADIEKKLEAIRKQKARTVGQKEIKPMPRLTKKVIRR